MFAQAPASAQPAFEVASVKVNNGGIGPGRGGRAQDPGLINYRNMAMRLLLIRAFDLKANEVYQIVMPSWVTVGAENQQRYDIDAKIPAGATTEQVPGMLQNLLVERFGMKFHKEKRDVPSYDLVVAKGGVKMKESAAGTLSTTGETAGRGRGLVLQKDRDGKEELAPGQKTALMLSIGPGALRYSGRLQTTAQIVNICRSQVGRPVTDKTGLTGSYDFNIDFAESGVPSGDEPAVGSNEPLDGVKEGLPPFLVAIQSLGLKLEPAKVATEVIVIDHLEKAPTAN
jgi:uncharacterized protein (TIGR03435 family)